MVYVENLGEESIHVEVIKTVLILYFFALTVIKMKKKKIIYLYNKRTACRQKFICTLLLGGSD